LGLSGDAAVDAYNRRGAERRREWPLSQVRAELDASFRDLLSEVATLTDEQLNRPLPAPWQNATTLERLIAVNSYEHNPEHIEHIVRWRERERPGAPV
jgi:hypothetical protein